VAASRELRDPAQALLYERIADRIASSHDIFGGQTSINGSSKTGRRRSQARLLLVTRETFDSGERILTTIAQNKCAKRRLSTDYADLRRLRKRSQYDRFRIP